MARPLYKSRLPPCLSLVLFLIGSSLLIQQSNSSANLSGLPHESPLTINSKDSAIGVNEIVHARASEWPTAKPHAQLSSPMQRRVQLTDQLWHEPNARESFH